MPQWTLTRRKMLKSQSLHKFKKHCILFKRCDCILFSSLWYLFYVFIFLVFYFFLDWHIIYQSDTRRVNWQLNREKGEKTWLKLTMATAGRRMRAEYPAEKGMRLCRTCVTRRWQTKWQPHTSTSIIYINT